MRTAVVTIARGRHDHLAAQARALTQDPPDLHVVVAMDDRDLAAVVPGAEVVDVPLDRGALPLAAARNAGVRRARELRADLLVLLDVDCIPSPNLLGRYREAAATHGGVLCGPVGYLPPPPAGGYPPTGLADLAVAHPARPVPGDDEVLAAPEPDLFWSLSFATTPDVWDEVGGFCEDYRGYGGEDTDFGHAAARAGVAMFWVGGAWAWHQHHGAGGTPVQHLDDILRNATVFHDRWGWWPMLGWLDDLRQRGLAHVDARGRWVRS